MNHKSNPKGIRYRAETKKYNARIKINKREISKSFDNEADAIAWHKQMKANRDGSCFLSCEKLFPAWLESLKDVTEYSPQTVTRYQSITKNYLLPHVGHCKMTDISENAITDFATTLKTRYRNLDNKTVKNVVYCLSNFFDYCYLHKYLTLNPIKTPTFAQHFALLVKRKQHRFKDSVVERARSLGELKLLIEAAYDKDFEFGLIAEFLFVTALRLGEAAALTWGDILENGFLYEVIVQKTRYGLTKEIQHMAKSGSNGGIPLTEQITQKLFELKKRLNASGFSTSKNDAVFPRLVRNQKGWSKQLGELAKRLNIRHTTAHCLRHSSLTYLANKGHNIQQIQKYARHSDIKMSKAYIAGSHLGIDGLAKTMDGVVIPLLRAG